MIRTLFVATLALVAANANAHTMSEHGNILVLTEDQLGLGTGALIESVAPGAVPNGVLWYIVPGVQGGDTFTVVADDGQELQMIGFADECPGPAQVRQRTTAAILAGDINGGLNIFLNEFWLLCNYIPDFDAYFTGGTHDNGPGDESGTVPGSGDAVIVLYEGDVGEGFTYSEA